MKDLHSKLLLVTAIGAAVLSADAASAAVDLQGYNSAEVVLAIGAGGVPFADDKRIDFVLLHSDDGATFDVVDADDVLGAAEVDQGIFKSLDAPHAAATSHRFGYKGGRRYLKLAIDFVGAHATGTPIAVLVIKSDGFNRPEVDQA